MSGFPLVVKFGGGGSQKLSTGFPLINANLIEQASSALAPGATIVATIGTVTRLETGPQPQLGFFRVLVTSDERLIEAVDSKNALGPPLDTTTTQGYWRSDRRERLRKLWTYP